MTSSNMPAMASKNARTPGLNLVEIVKLPLSFSNVKEKDSPSRVRRPEWTRVSSKSRTRVTEGAPSCLGGRTLPSTGMLGSSRSSRICSSSDGSYSSNGRHVSSATIGPSRGASTSGPRRVTVETATLVIGLLAADLHSSCTGVWLPMLELGLFSMSSAAGCAFPPRPIRRERKALILPWGGAGSASPSPVSEAGRGTSGSLLRFLPTLGSSAGVALLFAACI
mmetsp:Transcript_2325/g.8272  ORF Transcript_2325/g.8272 Transcript_2325/m.8272 type:complete len:223 (+) Transcript_2325:493-1161(+)